MPTYSKVLAITSDSQIITWMASHLLHNVTVYNTDRKSCQKELDINEMQEHFERTHSEEHLDTMPCDITSQLYWEWASGKIEIFKHVHVTFGLNGVPKYWIELIRAMLNEADDFYITPRNFWMAPAETHAMSEAVLLDTTVWDLCSDVVDACATAQTLLRKTNASALDISVISPLCACTCYLITCDLPALSKIRNILLKNNATVPEELTMFYSGMLKQVVDKLPWTRGILLS